MSTATNAAQSALTGTGRRQKGRTLLVILSSDNPCPVFGSRPLIIFVNKSFFSIGCARRSATTIITCHRNRHPVHQTKNERRGHTLLGQISHKLDILRMFCVSAWHQSLHYTWPIGSCETFFEEIGHCASELWLAFNVEWVEAGDGMLAWVGNVYRERGKYR